MDAANLERVLEQHRLWLLGEGGGRANLRYANLSGADLSGADLSGANLSGANLSGATGIVCVNFHDPRGYRPVAVNHGGGWRIYSGCRSLMFAEALQHWGEGYRGDKDIGQGYLCALKELPPCPAVDAPREVA